MRALTPGIAGGAAWLAALVAIVVVAVAAPWTTAAHGYFAAWLIAVSLPLGALPVLMIMDLAGARETAARAALRLLLGALPVLALLLVPVLLDLRAVFPWPTNSLLARASAEPLKGLAVHWYLPGFFGLRSVVYLVIWVALSLFFVRAAPPSPRHRAVAGIGLGLHLVVGTLAAFDWWMSLDQAFLSSVYGLLVIVSQAALAMIAAALIGIVTEADLRLERPFVLALLTVLCAAAFLQFSQYLVIWSANLPKEIVWYQARWVGALGPAFVIGAPTLLVVAAVALVPSALASLRLPTAAALGALLLVALLDLACLASPRGSFTVAGAALVLVFLIVVGGLGAACASVMAERRPGKPRHG